MIDLIVSIDADGDFCGDCAARPFIRDEKCEPCKFFGVIVPSKDSLCWWSEYEGRFVRCRACQDAEQKRLTLQRGIDAIEEEA